MCRTTRCYASNTYRSLAREHLEGFLDKVLLELLGNVVQEVAGDTPLPNSDRIFIAKFYSYAFSGILLDWIKEGIQKPAAQLAVDISLIMEGTIQLAVARFRA